MLYSQNGYSANNSSLMASYTVPTTKVRVTLRKGDVSVILLYLLEQYDNTVEPLTQADTGGYNPRSIIGARTISNHGSGTAVDTRWKKHPRGKRNTFTAKQKTAVRKILGFLEGVVRWGEDYKSAPVDGMHFEVIGQPAAVARMADKIRRWRDKPTAAGAPGGKATVAVKAPGWPKGTPAFREADRPKYSATVRGWQARMKARGWAIAVDGRYGHKSADVAATFQREKHLGVDRLLGPQTFAAAWTAPRTA
jgi:hypothetical protein